MSLAASLNEDNIDSAAHELDEDTIQQWNQLKNIADIAPKVLPEDVVMIGLRDYEKEEKQLIDKYGIKVITTKELRNKGVEQNH